MTDEDKVVREFGKALDSFLGGGPGESDLNNYKSALVTAMASRSNRRRMWRPLVMAAAAGFAACAIIAGFAWVGFSTGDEEHILKFKIGTDAHYSAPGSVAQSEQGSRVPIVFSTGSRFELVDSSVVRVIEATESRATIQLTHGRLDNWIRGNGTTEWVVIAGSYRVSVLGTVFSVFWNEETSDLKVRVKEGRVRVASMDKSQSDVTLQAGYWLTANSQTGFMSILEAPAPDQANGTSAGAQEIESQTAPEDPTEPGEPRPDGDRLMELDQNVKTKRRKIRPGNQKLLEPESQDAQTGFPWRAYCKEAQFKKAIQHAEAHDISEMAQQADIDALWRLANGARHVKKGRAAIRLFKALRTRFSHTGQAETAAFLIAKTELEINGDKHAARKWFETYLGGTKDGPLTEEALGHLMGILVSMQQKSEAGEIAKRYLNFYPDGLFSKRAGEIISN